MLLGDDKRGQMTAIIIVAIVIVAALIVYFAARNIDGVSGVPEELRPVYDYYEQCMASEMRNAVALAGMQGGRLDSVDYVPGSDFAPFSSHLGFLGESVPYWYYVSGNGLVKENVPTKKEIEADIAVYLENVRCNFDEFYEQGYEIEIGEPKVAVSVGDESVNAEIASRVGVKKGESSAVKNEHSAKIDSKFGSFYKEAVEIYNKERKELFLENYSADILRLYAPVDGVELSCSPRVWKSRDVAEELLKAVEANMAALKFDGDYYSMKDKKNKYFIINEDVNNAVRVLYSRNWPTRIEIDGADELMVAEPVGNQEGLGVLGFCYAPYHFVYDMSFPVMMQIYDGEEMFQYPLVVVIDNNMPVKSLGGVAVENEVDICQYRTQDLLVETKDVQGKPVDAQVSYICINQRCPLGETEEGSYEGKAPSCANGFIQARAEGYAEKKQLFSSTSERVAELILEREHDINVSVLVDGKELVGSALVSFNGMQSRSAMLPETNNVRLSEGAYNISVYVYGNSTITIPASKKTECYEVASSGIAGFFGSTKEECVNIELPETKIDYALLGGGRLETYLLESDLESGKIVLQAEGLQKPTTLEQLHYNYGAFDGLRLEVEFG